MCHAALSVSHENADQRAPQPEPTAGAACTTTMQGLPGYFSNNAGLHAANPAMADCMSFLLPALHLLAVEAL
jgi:hypothetical protein